MVKRSRLSKKERMKVFADCWDEESKKHLERYGTILKKDSHFITKKCLKKVGLT
jgi:hypothetical protein